MIPGEIDTLPGNIYFNQKYKKIKLDIANSGDRPIQVGSHYHFYESNSALLFEREKTYGMRLNITSGTAVRFEPGQVRTVELVEYAGSRTVYGFKAAVMGELNS